MAYNKLSTANLPDPVIDPAQGSSPEDYFGTVVWAGNGSATKRTDIQFDGVQPDLVWLKNRTLSRDHALHDDVRGLNARIKSNNTETESTSDAPFDTDGFGFNGVDTQLRIATTNSSYNASGSSYVAWGWKASGASGVSNTDGSITSTVSANTTSGFSIVSYTGTGASATVGHGLDATPDMLIIKNRDNTRNWAVWHKALGGDNLLKLNLTDSVVSNPIYFGGGNHTSSVFELNTHTLSNESGLDHIAYCFHSVEGFSKFGSYVANGSSDGPFIYTGFSPAFLMVKRASNAGAPWSIIDNTRNTYNKVNLELDANTSVAEFSINNGADFVSNGVKLRDSAYLNSSSGNTFIYMAFAENPFKYSNAR